MEVISHPRCDIIILKQQLFTGGALAVAIFFKKV